MKIYSHVYTHYNFKIHNITLCSKHLSAQVGACYVNSIPMQMSLVRDFCYANGVIMKAEGNTCKASCKTKELFMQVKFTCSLPRPLRASPFDTPLRNFSSMYSAGLQCDLIL